MDRNIELYKIWKEKAIDDTDLIKELNSMDNATIEDAFYRDLAFGTGGLRGVIGAGTNRMNVYTVAKASQGLANYIINNFDKDDRVIAISYDSRIKSDLFAKIAAEVFVANGIKTYIYSELMPTPCLSFAVRKLRCAAGIMVTASHNPSKYNGYKVYGNDGCQITTEMARAVLQEIESIDIWNDVKRKDFDKSILSRDIEYISEDVYTDFVENVKRESVAGDFEIDKDVAIIYSPLHGTGLKPVTRTLREMGYTNITIVKEQEEPDGNFTTCPYPNPEIKEAMALGMEYAKKYNADLLLATDPDCDRVGIAVKNKAGEMQLVTGNEVGLLLLDYICARRIANGTMPEHPVCVKTIVTTDMADKIAKHYGVVVRNVLTGFKFIGEQIGLLEKDNKENNYILGFEESYGYLSGTYVRDKDAVNGAMLIVEMFAYYKTLGINLLDKLDELYKTYGYALNTLHSYTFEGMSGFNRMNQIMAKLRGHIDKIGGVTINKTLDYSESLDGLPKSDVLKFLGNDTSIVVRPSGTEPKLKLYISVTAPSREDATKKEKSITSSMETIMKIEK